MSQLHSTGLIKGDISKLIHISERLVPRVGERCPSPLVIGPSSKAIKRGSNATDSACILDKSQVLQILVTVCHLLVFSGATRWRSSPTVNSAPGRAPGAEKHCTQKTS